MILPNFSFPWMNAENSSLQDQRSMPPMARTSAWCRRRQVSSISGRNRASTPPARRPRDSPIQARFRSLESFRYRRQIQAGVLSVPRRLCEARVAGSHRGVPLSRDCRDTLAGDHGGHERCAPLETARERDSPARALSISMAKWLPLPEPAVHRRAASRCASRIRWSLTVARRDRRVDNQGKGCDMRVDTGTKS